MRKALVTASLVALLAIQPALAQTNTSTDITKPTISGVTFGSVKATTAVVSWMTNEPATSYVDFGLTEVYDKTLGEGSYVTTHSVTLLGMTAETLYHFRVRSKDAAGNETVSTDTILPTIASTVNTNTVTNTNTVVNLNANKNTNTAVNKNANANTNKNTNVNKNSNTNKNANLNANKNTNLNGNTNTGSDLFNQNANTSTTGIINSSVDTNTDLTNVNASTPIKSSDGRAGIALIALGIILLFGIVGFAWWKARRPPTVRP